MTVGQESICRVCPHRKDSVFSELTESRLEEWCNLKTVTLYRKDQRVFYESEPSLGLHIVCSGRVKLSRSSPMGRKQILAIEEPCGLLKENDLFRSERHTVTAEAMDESVVGFVTRDDFHAFLRKNPSVALRMLDHLAVELERVEDTLHSFVTMDVTRRLADLLLRLADRHGRAIPEGRLIDVALTREEWSEMIGTTPETVIRVLSAFRKGGMIAEHDKRVILLDEGRLKRTACYGAPSSG
ncbi:MAG: Crp/Fnr family transcriptional regulator [Nitrospiria bacterium]